jgi:bis(5'-nucleosyl)-tetraphosphatase (symmetrical)
MATYVIGDIHGCSRTLEALLDRIQYKSGQDRLWLTGDLVNRGPDSLGVLRWALAQGENLISVLGNHDVHLLGAALRVPGFRARQAFDPILQAPDADALLAWVRSRPLLHREGDRVLVHAGLLPAWELDYAFAQAAGCESVLAEDGAVGLLTAARALGLRRQATPDSETDRLAEFLQIVTLLRLVDDRGRWVRGWIDPPQNRPPATHAWFDAPGRRHQGGTIYFGHWATLGLLLREDLCCLDSGCVWGRALSALRLEDGRLFQQQLLDQRPDHS